LLTGSLNFTINIETQKIIFFLIPLLPIFIIFFIGSIAETNRAPFDLAEAESELVSGFMTEHAAVIFVFFFLAEYASIVLICILASILFMGGYLLDISSFIYIFQYLLNIIYDFNSFDELTHKSDTISYIFNVITNPFVEGIFYGLCLSIKACILIFVFI
jgi:NADH-ubiquinone oxidoreductase chain 1